MYRFGKGLQFHAGFPDVVVVKSDGDTEKEAAHIEIVEYIALVIGRNGKCRR